ncbi:MAG: hypothetical protein ACRDOK_05315 [Streptosporangiaceae bacterium]
MTDTEVHLDQIRGPVPPRPHNARTIAALTTNPGCVRRAILDAAGVDKPRLAAACGYLAPFGQSRFAITRGNAFEALVKANGCAELLRLLRDKLRLPIPEVSYADLEAVAGNTSLPVRHARTRQLLTRTAGSGEDAGTLFDHPLLTLEVGGRLAYLEPDLIAFRLRNRFHVVEIKSFAAIDGQADPGKVAAAAIQSAVYALAMRQLLAESRSDPELVADEVILVCPENFSNRPVAGLLDVRKQLTVLRRQLSRLALIADLVELYPPDVCFDLDPDETGAARRPAAELAQALAVFPARYAPECLASCEMCRFCRHEARATTAALGRAVREELGGLEYIDAAVRLAAGELEPSDGQQDAAALLRAAARLRAECFRAAG